MPSILEEIEQAKIGKSTSRNRSSRSGGGTSILSNIDRAKKDDSGFLSTLLSEAGKSLASTGINAIKGVEDIARIITPKSA